MNEVGFLRVLEIPSYHDIVYWQHGCPGRVSSSPHSHVYGDLGRGHARRADGMNKGACGTPSQRVTSTGLVVIRDVEKGDFFGLFSRRGLQPRAVSRSSKDIMSNLLVTVENSHGRRAARRCSFDRRPCRSPTG